MPILAAEPDQYPESLFDQPTAGEWWVAHTKPRQEKALARRLREVGVAFYAPTAPKRALVRGRVRTSRLPLFPGYAFVHGTAADRLRVLATNRAARVLTVADQGRLWADLGQVRALLGTGRPVFPEDRIEPGSPVRVTAGPLAGLTGTVLRHGGGRRFVVRVDFLSRGVAVELDDVLLARTIRA
jgi:transcription antitermination factor NusG